MSSKEFQQMRFSILAASLNPATEAKIPEDYVFAWDYGVYPIANSTQFSEPFVDDFEVTKEMMAELVDLLDEESNLMLGVTWNFDRLAQHFDAFHGLRGWNVQKLTHALKYLYITNKTYGMFSPKFLNSVIRDKKHPNPVAQIICSYNRHEDVDLI